MTFAFDDSAKVLGLHRRVARFDEGRRVSAQRWRAARRPRCSRAAATTRASRSIAPAQQVAFRGGSRRIRPGETALHDLRSVLEGRRRAGDRHASRAAAGAASRGRQPGRVQPGGERDHVLTSRRRPIDSVPADSLVGKAVFDLWNYKDPTLQPAQKLSAARDRNKSYQAIYFTGDQEAGAARRRLDPERDVVRRLRRSASPIRASATWSSRCGATAATDVYVIDATTGARKVVKEHIDGNGAALAGREVRRVLRQGPLVLATTSRRARSPTSTRTAKGVQLRRRRRTTRRTRAPAWGIAGWTKGDQSVLIYDRFDIWERRSDRRASRRSSSPIRSAARARSSSVSLRAAAAVEAAVAAAVARAARAIAARIDPTKPLMLRAFSEHETKASGFYRDRARRQARRRRRS